MNLQRAGWIALALLLFVAGFAISSQISEARIARAQQDLIEQLGVIQDDLTVVRNQRVNAEKALALAIADNERVIDQLATMEAKVSDLEYIIHSRGNVNAPPPTVIEVPVEVAAQLDHEFLLDNDIKVAEVKSEGTQVHYTTYPLDFETSVVVTEDKVSVDVLMSSAADPSKQARVIQETSSIAVRDKEEKPVRAQIALGATLIADATPELAVSVQMPWLHPTPVIDALTPRLSANHQTIAGGIDVISYNVGEPLPLVDNLWISAGANITHRAELGAAITIGAKL